MWVNKPLRALNCTENNSMLKKEGEKEKTSIIPKLAHSIHSIRNVFMTYGQNSSPRVESDEEQQTNARESWYSTIGLSGVLNIRPSWNTSFSSVIKILHLGSASIPKNVTAIRFITDNAIPTWLPTMPIGVSSQLSTNPPGEWHFPSSYGLRFPPEFDIKTSKYILYFHGGAFCLCNSATHRGLLHRLVSTTGATIFAADYRRPPEHPYPTPLDDCYEAYVFLLNKVGDSSKIILAGDSAGGNLVISTLIRIHETSLPQASRAIILSPWIDLTDIGRNESWNRNEKYDYLDKGLAKLFAEAYIGNSENIEQDMLRVSPLYFDNLHVLPPILVEFGDCEVLHDQILLFCQRLQELNVDVIVNCRSDMVHVFPVYAFTNMAQCTSAIRAMTLFINQ